ncbi:right-handed parallel beta-helix repeat-containing protein, partial [Candidatus Micrarchaeota archaeon]|nr:right-handed parallel beta-helix repeat-containing protein [Candidatus Micrarchaeota archaeon]
MLGTSAKTLLLAVLLVGLAFSAAPVVENVSLTTSEGGNTASENLTLYYDSYDTDNDAIANITNWFVDGASITALYLPFEANGGSESSSTTDYSNNSNDATVYGATWNPTGGFDGSGAYEFDGDNDYLSSGNPVNLRINETLTVELWVRVNDPGSSTTTIVSKGAMFRDAASYYAAGYGIGYHSGKYYFDLYTTDGAGTYARNYKSVYMPESNTSWHHLAMTFDSGVAAAYIDGQFNSTWNTTYPELNTPSYDLRIGVDGLAWNGYLDGSVDNLRIYGRVLSAEQILAIYENRTDIIVSDETSVGDTWYACVTPNDGTEDGTQVCSNGVTIQEDPPGMTSCEVISSPGTYSLGADLEGAPNAVSGVSEVSQACIVIASSGVTLNCNGHTIINNGTSDAAGILINGSTDINYTNVLIENCPNISSYERGIYLHRTAHDAIRNTTVYNSSASTDRALHLYGSSSNNVTNCTLWGYYSIYLDAGSQHNSISDSIIYTTLYYPINLQANSDYNSITNNTLYGGGSNAYLYSSSYNNLSGNVFQGAINYGLYVQPSSTHNIITNNTAHSTKRGFYLHSASNNNSLINNTAYNNSYYGFIVESSSYNNLTGNTAYNNTEGFYLTSSSTNILSNNSAYNNTAYGLHVSSGSGNSILNMTFFNNGYDFYAVSTSYILDSCFILNPAGTFSNYTSLSIEDAQSGGEEYTINWSATPGSNPTNRIPFEDKFVNISEVAGSPNVASIIWSWLDSEAEGYTESNFELWKYNSSGWTLLNGTPDTSANTLAIYGHDIASIYGIFSTVANSPPAAENVTLNTSSGDNRTNENLTLHYDLHDANGDSIENATNWYVDSASLTLLNLNFEPNGGQNATDYSGYGRNGTAEGAVPYGTSGLGGSHAYDFQGSGSGDGMNLGTWNISSAAFSVEAWFYADSYQPTNPNGIATKWRNTDNSRSWLLGAYDSSGRPNFCISSTGSDYACMYASGSSMSTGKWHHIVATYDGTDSSGISIYVDGSAQSLSLLSSVGNPTGPVYNSTAKVYLGRSEAWSGSAFYFDGRIDNVRVYARELSLGQVTALYNNRTDLIVPQETEIGEIWQACVTPNDGTEDGNETCSNTLEIRNQLPVTENVTLNSTFGTNYSTENLTLHYDSYDGDNDAIKNITNWYLNGTPIAVLNMPFEGGSNSTYTKDYSNFSNDGTVAGATYNATGGYDGLGAYEFNGINQKIVISALPTMASWTLSAWVNPSTVDATLYNNPDGFDILSNDQSGWNDDVLFGICPEHTGQSPNKKFALIHQDDESDVRTVVNDSVDAVPGTWYHVVGTSDGTTLKLYVNGVERDSETKSGNDLDFNGAATWIGATPNNFRGWNGSIAGVTVYNRTLSAEQVWALYNNRTGILVSQETEVGETWYACVTPNDGTEDGSEVCSNSLEIQDNQNPALSISSPANTTYNTSWVSLNYTASDDSGLDSCWFTLDGGSGNTSISSCTNGTISGLSEGAHNVTVYVNDTTNNANSSTVYFSVDTTAPTVAISSPANTTYATNNFTVNYTTDGASCALYLNGIFNTTLPSCENTTISSLTDGQHYVTVYANDSVNNTGSDEVYFIVDTIAPTITLSSPANTTYPTNNLTVNYTTNGISCSMFLDGTFNESLASCENTTLTELADGQHYVTIYSNDSVNNTGSDEVYFIVDTTAPTLSITSPANTTYATNNMSVNYTTDGAVCALFLDGALNASLASCENTTLSNLTEGQHYVTIYANDSVNNTGSDEVYFTIDTTAPTVAITSPANTTYSTNNMTVNYTTDGATCAMFLDSSFNTSLASCENTTLTGLSDGQHYVTIYSNDSVNNTGSDEVYFMVDTTAPTVTISSPANTTYPTNNLTVNYTTEGVSCSMFLDGAFNESLASCGNTTLYNLSNGQHYVTIYANDSVNNTGSDEVYFISWFNYLPVAENLTLNSSSGNNLTYDNLTIHYDSHDANGDAIANITNWFVDGTSITALNMPFEGGSNATYTKDYSNQSNDAEVYSATWNATSGYNGHGAYTFDGTNDYLEIQDSPELDSADITVSVWVYMDGTTGEQNIIDHRDTNSPCGGYNLWVEGSSYPLEVGFKIVASDCGTYYSMSTGALPQDTWVHLVGVWDSVAQETRVYVNGTLGDSDPHGVAKGGSSSPLRVGDVTTYGTSVPSAYNFKGIIDELAIYGRALSDEQILAIYENRTGTIVSNETSVGEIWYACVTPNDGTLDGNEACSNSVQLSESITDLWINETINFSDSSPRQNDIVEINATIYSDLTQNYSNVNVSLYVDSEYANSTLLNITDGYALASFNWAAEPGNKSILIAVDPEDSLNEYNETNNNASAYLFVKKVAVFEYAGPLNATEIIRGYTDSVPEDPENYVPDYTTLRARVYNYYNSSEGLSANCTFYFNGTYLGANETDSNGNCSYSFDHTAYAAGAKELIANFTDLDPACVKHTSGVESEASLIITIYQSQNWELNARSPGYYLNGDAAILEFNVTRDGALYDPGNITVEARKDSPDSIIRRHTYPGDIVRTGTGTYYSKTIINSSFSNSAIHWKIYIDDNRTVNGTAYEAIPATSGSHSDVGIDAETAALNFTATGAGETLLENTSITVYDRNLYELETDTLNSSNPYLERPGAQNDPYTLNYTTSNGSALLLREANATADFHVSPQFIEQYSGELPSTARNLSGAVALNTTAFNFTNATISIPLNGLTGIDYIYHCTEWDFAAGTCGAWVQNETSDYPDYSINSTHFSFIVYGFTGYAGGLGYNANLTIYDEYEESSAPQGADIAFYANYTNSTSGAHIAGATCNITFDDGNSSAMEDNGQNYNYTKSGGFEGTGIHAWNVSCGGTSYDALNATDAIEVIDGINPALSVSSPANTTYNTSTVSLNYTAGDETELDSCWFTLDGGSANTSISDCSNGTISGLADGAHNVTVYANDTSGNGNSSTVYFSVDTLAPALSIESPANITYATNNFTVNYTTDATSCFLVRDGISNIALPTCSNTTLTELSEGQHYITIYANDSVNNTNSSTVYFIADISAPAVSISIPANSTYNTNNLTVNYTTDGSTCSLFLDGTFNQSLSSCENATLANLSEGSHYVTVYANDSVNNTGEDTVYFSIDLSAPTVSISSPANTTYATNNLTVNYTSTGASCALFLDGTINQSLSSCENATLSNLTDGQHYVTIYANDSVNNTGSDEVYFTIDTIAPTISIESPANITYATNNFTVNYTTDATSCFLVRDGISNIALPTCSNTTLTELSEGQHYIIIYANDSVNNSNSSTVYFTADTSAPPVSISIPANSTYNTNNLSVNYTTSGVSCSLFLDGELNQTLASCENATLSNLTEGSHYATVYANDSVNNTGEDTVYFSVDLSAPGVSISSPANITYATNNLSVNYTTDGASCSLFLDGAFNASLSSCENTTLYGLSEAQHYITIYANDSVNNTGEDTVYFTIDTSAPVLSISSPANTTYATNNLSVNYTTDGVSCSLFLDGTLNQSLASCENTTLALLTDAQHYVTVYANDTSNNSNSSTVYFIVDTTAPTVSITSPSNTTYSTNNITVNYTTDGASCSLYL